MAFTAKFTVQRGKPDKGDIAIAAGSAETGRDMISLNIDADKLSKGEAMLMIDALKAAVFAADWPVH